MEYQSIPQAILFFCLEGVPIEEQPEVEQNLSFVVFMMLKAESTHQEEILSRIFLAFDIRLVVYIDSCVNKNCLLF